MIRFKSVQSQAEFLDQLKSITEEGSPNLAATSFSVFRIFSPPNTLPFFGIIGPNGFHISIVKGIYASSMALDGEITDTESGITIQVKFDAMIFPLVLHFLVITLAFTMGTFVFWLTGDFSTAIFPYCLSVSAFAFVRYLKKREKGKLLKLFMEHTTAVSFQIRCVI